MRVVLHMPAELAYTSYTLTAITAPVMGVLLGGAATHLVGGYTHPKALKMLTYVSLIGTTIALPLPLIDSYKAYLILFWLCLFMGGFIMPGLTGIMIHDAPKKEWAIANSVAFFSYNCFGYIPGPLVYGFISKITPPDSRIGMTVLVYALILSFILLLFACVGFKIKESAKNIRKIEKELKSFDGERMDSNISV